MTDRSNSYFVKSYKKTLVYREFLEGSKSRFGGWSWKDQVTDYNIQFNTCDNDTI